MSLLLSGRDLGVQIDDFPVTVAQTLVCGANEPVSGPVGDLLVAVQTAANAVLRMMLPGTMVCEYPIY